MTGEDTLLMSIKEVRKYEVIKQVIEKRMKQYDAADKLGISERQIRRLIKRVKVKGKEGLIHGLRGKKSRKRIKQKEKDRILRVCSKQYNDFSLSLMNEKLLEIDDIKINRESLRQILLSAGQWKPVRKSKVHRRWRERKAFYGEMLQLDGSIHDWLEGRGPQMVLMSFIDDATSRVYGEFYKYEGTVPAMDMTKKYIRKYGIPKKVYLDRHSTYKSRREPTIEEQLRNENPMSQYARALHELGVEVIHANSPQAKGRIERSFRTHQDRLVKEMRLAGIYNMKDANYFLKTYYMAKHNQKFGVEAAKTANLHTPLTEDMNLGRIMVIRTPRTVRNDYTVVHDGRMYQLNTKLPLKGRKVLVIEDLKARFKIEYKSKNVRFEEIVAMNKSVVNETKSEKIVRKKKRGSSHKPAKRHPWVTGDSWWAAS